MVEKLVERLLEAAKAADYDEAVLMREAAAALLKLEDDYGRAMAEKLTGSPCGDLWEIALHWWIGKRPLGWTQDEHLGNPEVNTTGERERAMCRLIAAHVKRPECGGPMAAPPEQEMQP